LEIGKIAGIAKNCQELKTLPLINTDDIDQKRAREKGHRRGRRCHMRIGATREWPETAIRKIEEITRS